MCGRYSLSQVDFLVERYGVTSVRGRLTPRWNVAPGQWMPIVMRTREEILLVKMRWGRMGNIVPPPGLINARAETITDLPRFRFLFQYRRCLISATGFY